MFLWHGWFIDWEVPVEDLVKFLALCWGYDRDKVSPHSPDYNKGVVMRILRVVWLTWAGNLCQLKASPEPGQASSRRFSLSWAPTCKCQSSSQSRCMMGYKLSRQKKPEANTLTWTRFPVSCQRSNSVHSRVLYDNNSPSLRHFILSKAIECSFII